MGYYVRTHARILVKVTAPDTVAGFRRVFQAHTKEINRTTFKKRRVVLRIVRSCIFMHAQRYLGEVRFQQLLREVGLSKRSPRLRWHRIIAENAEALLLRSDSLPDDDAALAKLCRAVEDH